MVSVWYNRNMAKIKSTQAAYLAGLIDGEGYIGLVKRNGTKNFICIPVICVVNTNKEIMDWLVAVFGGFIQKRNSIKYNANARTAYSWDFRGERCLSVLKTIQPFARIKQPQILILIEFIEEYYRRYYMKGSKGMPDSARAIHIQFHQHLKELNSRGNGK